MEVSGQAPAPKKKSIWETTPEKGVLRNRHSGQFYYRYTHNGKQKWVWLETDVYSVAKLRAWDKRKDAAKLRASVPAVSAGKATMGQLMDVYWTRTKENADLRPSTIVARGTGLKKIRKTWPGIADLRPQQITPPAVLKWANNFKKHGTKFTAPKNTVMHGDSKVYVDPRISANLLAQFMVSDHAKQEAIVRNAKRVNTIMVANYQPGRAAVSASYDGDGINVDQLRAKAEHMKTSEFSDEFETHCNRLSGAALEKLADFAQQIACTGVKVPRPRDGYSPSGAWAHVFGKLAEFDRTASYATPCWYRYNRALF